MDDNTPMPFGKYKNISMANVPAEYLLQIYKEDKVFENYNDLKDYIEDNLEVLKFELKNN